MWGIEKIVNLTIVNVVAFVATTQSIRCKLLGNAFSNNKSQDKITLIIPSRDGGDDNE